MCLLFSQNDMGPCNGLSTPKISLYTTGYSPYTRVDQKVMPPHRNFLVVSGSVLKMGMDIHWTFTYTQGKLCIYTFNKFLFMTSKVKDPLVQRKW